MKQQKEKEEINFIFSKNRICKNKIMTRQKLANHNHT